jgi:hypothetical protein
LNETTPVYKYEGIGSFRVRDARATYSLIYFIFRDDTYVVSSVFTCLMIIGEFAAGVKILLEKGPSRYHISEDQKF